MRLRDMSEKNDVKNSSSLIELNSTKRCCQKHSATIDFSGTLLFVNDEFFFSRHVPDAQIGAELVLNLIIRS